MLEAVKTERFEDLVRRPEVFDFARDVITRSYVECTPGRELDTRALLEQAFALLEGAAGDPAAFSQAVDTLRTGIFRKPEPGFWFNQIYKAYKRGFKPRRRLENLRPWLQGETVFDLGCGDGLTSLALESAGYRPFLTDVLDYRDAAARRLPFQAMDDPAVLPYPGGAVAAGGATAAGGAKAAGGRFDNALVMAVLHHVESAALDPLLDGLRSRTRRAIVEEDTYALPPGLESLQTVLPGDDLLRRFLQLSQEDQLRYLMFIDYFANAITQGITEMELPFNFKPLSEWLEVFQAHGFRTHAVQVMGFQPGFFNRSCHVWFILD